MRVGWGFDAHAFSERGPLTLGGVVISDDVGLEATSDGDLVAHAVADAVLGAAALGDLGAHFPSTDPRWQGADSMDLLREVARMAGSEGWRVRSVDVTVMAESIRLAPYREAIRNSLALGLELEIREVSVKGTSTDGMGFVGRGEGMAATAVVVLAPDQRHPR